MAGEITSMWIINENLIDQTPAQDRLSSSALDINTLSQQNQCIVFTLLIWLFHIASLEENVKAYHNSFFCV